MKSFLPFVFILLCAATVGAQNNYAYLLKNPADSLYPFNITLLSPDSARSTNSKELLALPKNVKERKPTVIAFWLTTCTPCHYELITYSRNYESWKSQADFNLYAISIDYPHNFRKIAKVARDMQFSMPVFWDSERLFRAVMPGELNGLPQVFIFDKNGKLAYRHKGFAPGDEEALFAKIKELQ